LVFIRFKVFEKRETKWARRLTFRRTGAHQNDISIPIVVVITARNASVSNTTGFSESQGLRFYDSVITNLYQELQYWTNLDETLGKQYNIDIFIVAASDTRAKLDLAQSLLRFSQELVNANRRFPAQQEYTIFGSGLASYTYEKSPIKQWNHFIDDLLPMFLGNDGAQ
jgi:hypothetical protein